MMLTAKLTCSNNQFDSVEILFSLTNYSERTVHLCKLFTPLEPLTNCTILSVMNEETKEQVDYNGRVAKRAPPSILSFVSVEPGETISNTLTSSP